MFLLQRMANIVYSGMATKYSKMLSHGNRVMRHVTSSRRQASDDVTKSHGMQRRLEGKVAVITGSTGG